MVKVMKVCIVNMVCVAEVKYWNLNWLRVKRSTIRWFSHKKCQSEVTVYVSKVKVAGVGRTTPSEIGGHSARVREKKETKRIIASKKIM